MNFILQRRKARGEFHTCPILNAVLNEVLLGSNLSLIAAYAIHVIMIHIQKENTLTPLHHRRSHSCADYNWK